MSLAKIKVNKVKLTRSSKLFKCIINAIEEKKGENIISLDLRNIPEAVADFFIICNANNTTQLRAIADSIDKETYDKCGEKPYKIEGRQAQQWIIIDFVAIVVHVMMPDARQFYQIEELWNDAPRVAHN